MAAVAMWLEQYKILAALGAFFLMGILTDLTAHKPVGEVLRDRWERLLLYSTAILVAHVVDWIALNDLLGWNFTTRLLVALALAGREGLFLVRFMAERGLDIPILRYRLEKLLNLEASDESTAELKRLIAELKAERERASPSAEASDTYQTPSI